MAAKKKKKEVPHWENIITQNRKRLSFLVKMDTRKMILYPLVVFIAALLLLVIHPPQKGTDLRGGVVVTVYNVDASPKELASYLKEKTGISLSAESFQDPVTRVKGIRIYAPADADPDALSSAIKAKYPEADVYPRKVDPTFGNIAQKQGIKAVIYAFIGMAVVVFLFFRDPIPSGTIVF
jgi:preprotein translocase subunit SecF